MKQICIKPLLETIMVAILFVLINTFIMVFYMIFFIEFDLSLKAIIIINTLFVFILLISSFIYIAQEYKSYKSAIKSIENE